MALLARGPEARPVPFALMCLHQFGALPQERILASIRRVGEHLIPHFAKVEA